MRLQRRILRSEPDRCRVVVGEPATVSDLRSRFENGGDARELATFISRQRALALERAERSVIGTQYKVPRFVSLDYVDRRRLPMTLLTHPHAPIAGSRPRRTHELGVAVHVPRLVLVAHLHS